METHVCRDGPPYSVGCTHWSSAAFQRKAVVKKKYWGIVLLAVIAFGITYEGIQQKRPVETAVPPDPSEAKVTFIELGSVNCIPCRAMQPVMKALEEKFRGQIRVVFYDVWEDEKPARAYGIRVIPTQVFLDDKGSEFHRHEGFYPLDQIVELLMARGLKPLED